MAVYPFSFAWSRAILPSSFTTAISAPAAMSNDADSTLLWIDATWRAVHVYYLSIQINTTIDQR